MTIDWNNFTPWASLAGGVMIGLASALFLLFNGKIAGISGIVGGLLRPVLGEIAWRIAFVAGILVSPLLFGAARSLPQVDVDAGYPMLIAAGMVVGLGTRYGSGCTSGHGVSGLSRRSTRSIVATGAFMFAGFVTVFIVRHVLG